MSQVSRVTDRNFDQEISRSEIPVLVEFWASWCLPCKAVDPILDELAQEYAGKIKIGKLNVDQNPQAGGKYQIKGVPTFTLFNSGQIVQQRVGAQSKGQLKEMIESALKR
jgi:thioredoxin 1